MKIAVLVKEVPDTWGDRKLDLSTGLVDRGASDPVIDEIGERAIEVALKYKDDTDAEVVLVSVGPATAKDMLRKGLAMGADSAVHVLDDSLAGSDMLATSAVLAAAVKHVGADLVIAGNESTDGRGGAMAAMVAERLGLPHVTNLESVQIAEGSVSGTRAIEFGTQQVSAQLPAIVSITERNPEARFANFKGIMRAKKKPLDALSASDLGASTPSNTSVVKSVAERPARQAGTKIVDEGDAAQQLAKFLADGHLI